MPRRSSVAVVFGAYPEASIAPNYAIGVYIDGYGMTQAKFEAIYGCRSICTLFCEAFYAITLQQILATLQARMRM